MGWTCVRSSVGMLALAGALGGILGGVSGCAHGEGAGLPARAAADAFVIGVEDLIEVSVYRDPELSRTLPVRPDGRLSIPLVGDVEAAGRTPADVRQEVATKLRPWVQDPQAVSVLVREVRSARVYVTGEVARPGAYPLGPQLTPVQAVALAGGPGEFSERDRVQVVRGDKRFSVSMRADQAAHQPKLESGDTLVVQ